MSGTLLTTDSTHPEKVSKAEAYLRNKYLLPQSDLDMLRSKIDSARFRWNNDRLYFEFLKSGDTEDPENPSQGFDDEKLKKTGLYYIKHNDRNQVFRIFRLNKEDSGASQDKFFLLTSDKIGHGVHDSTAFRAVLLNGEMDEDPEYIIKETLATKAGSITEESRNSAFALEVGAMEKLYPGKSAGVKKPHSPYYIIRPFLKGKSLNEIDTDNPYLYIFIIKKVLDGLNILHKEGMSHGDIKPEHFYIDAIDTEKPASVIDLGHTGEAALETETGEFPASGTTKPGFSKRPTRVIFGSTLWNFFSNIWSRKWTSLPFRYWFIPGKWWNPTGKFNVKLSEDVYVLGCIFQDKVNKNEKLKKNKFLVDLCAKMTDKDGTKRITVQNALNEVNHHLNVVETDTTNEINTLLKNDDSSEQCYESLCEALRKIRPTNLTAVVEKAYMDMKDPGATDYTTFQLKKMGLLKRAYLTVFEWNLYALSEKANKSTNKANAISFTDEAMHLVNTAKQAAANKTGLLKKRRIAYTSKTKAEIELTQITKRWEDQLYQHKVNYCDDNTLKEFHNAFCNNPPGVNYKTAIKSYVNVNSNVTGVIKFAISYKYNKEAIEQEYRKPYGKVDDFAYLGIIPGPNEEILHNTIHSVVSFVDWHEYLGPFNIKTTQPSDWARKGIKQLVVPFADYTATIDTNVAIDALFKIAQQCQEARAQNKRIYFHCKAGRSRSAMMLALTLYHQHRHLQKPPNINYTLDDAYAAIKKSCPHADIDAKKMHRAREIVVALDAFHAKFESDKATGALLPAVAVNTTDHKFIWDKIMQLPAIKTLLIEYQQASNCQVNIQSCEFLLTNKQIEINDKAAFLHSFFKVLPEDIAKDPSGNPTHELKKSKWYNQIEMMHEENQTQNVDSKGNTNTTAQDVTQVKVNRIESHYSILKKYPSVVFDLKNQIDHTLAELDPTKKQAATSTLVSSI